MLPASHRLRRGADLRRVAREGSRAGARSVVVHLLLATEPGAPAARVGFVVGRGVGNAVVRHRVQRRLRHLCRDRLGRLPSGSGLVVRALGPAATATYQELGADLDRCLQRVLERSLERGTGAVS